VTASLSSLQHSHRSRCHLYQQPHQQPLSSKGPRHSHSLAQMVPRALKALVRAPRKALKAQTAPMLLSSALRHCPSCRQHGLLVERLVGVLPPRQNQKWVETHRRHHCWGSRIASLASQFPEFVRRRLASPQKLCRAESNRLWPTRQGPRRQQQRLPWRLLVRYL